MFSTEKMAEWKRRLENELLVNNAWLEDNQECLTEEETKTYEPSQITAVQEQRIRLCNEKRARKKDIEDALKRMKAGTFGICVTEGCGREIDPERLEGDLTRKRDANCQIEYEHSNKKNGKGLKK
jgi:RNA polymerase-binding transcription factor DksA